MLVVAIVDADEHVYGARQAGASGFVLKDSPPDQLLAAGRVAAAGNVRRPDIVEETTIKTHVSRFLMKLDLRDRVQAVIPDYQTPLVKPG